MAMGEVLPAILVIAAIYFAIRWFMGPSQTVNADGTIPGVNPAMVETIHSAFPDVPIKNIVYNLSKTRSAQATSEEILERGYLPSPPNDFTVPPALLPADSQPAEPTPASSPSSKPSTASIVGKSLLERYGLSSLPTAGGGVARDVGETLGEKGKWESSKEARERGLRERKERMILEARRRMMEKQTNPTSTSSASSSTAS